MPQPYDPTVFVTPGVPANDYEDGLENPDWTPTFTTDGAMTFDVERHGHAGVRTIHGGLDVMEDIAEETGELIRRFLEGELPPNELPEWLRRVLPVNLPPPVDVRADVNPARHFRTTTYVIPGGGQPTLISAMADRLRAVLTNTGPTPCQISWTDNATNINTGGAMEWVTLSAGSPGASSSTPAVNNIPLAATGVASYNNNSTGVNLTVGGGTVTQIAINGTNTNLTSGTFFVPAGGTVTVTYTVPPTTFTTAGIAVTSPPTVLPWNSRTLLARGKIYAYSTFGTTLDVQEEYGELERRGTYVAPSGG